FQYVPDIRILLMPVFLVMAFITAYGFTVWFCALNVRYRDFRYIIPFVVQFGLYISPVGFSSSIVPDELRLIYSLNPMVGVIDGFRWSILGRDVAIYWPGFILSMILITTVAIFGLMYFRKTEKSFADVL
ncbi:MAG TPA: ABC transporter permease, partial [Candidatus Cloacimonadota bacterium]|nr:ABC transporter permease [Candidatus Cloacimonadota bacterium]